jgi:hypothetical protein
MARRRAAGCGVVHVHDVEVVGWTAEDFAERGCCSSVVAVVAFFAWSFLFALRAHRCCCVWKGERLPPGCYGVLLVLRHHVARGALRGTTAVDITSATRGAMGLGIGEIIEAGRGVKNKGTCVMSPTPMHYCNAGCSNCFVLRRPLGTFGCFPFRLSVFGRVLTIFMGIVKYVQWATGWRRLLLRALPGLAPLRSPSFNLD